MFAELTFAYKVLKDTLEETQADPAALKEAMEGLENVLAEECSVLLDKKTGEWK
jgi:hypothetical protein